MRGKGRGLRPEELDLWSRVTRQAQPLDRAKRAPKMTAPAFPTPAARPLAEGKDTSLPSFRIGERATPDGPARHHWARPEARADAAPAMDRKTFTRMKRGKLRIDARLDLHGMTLAEAHPRLTGFVLDAHARGQRLVLVITGKGTSLRADRPFPERRGILKRQVPHWLRGPALGHAVLQVVEAHPAHGGAGAYYVYLRRRR